MSPTAYGVWAIAIGGAVYLLTKYMEERRLSRHLSIRDREAMRAGFTKQLESVQAANATLSAQLSDVRREYDEYRHQSQQESDGYRASIMRLESEINGLRRRIDFIGIWLAKQFGEIPSELVDHVSGIVELRAKS